MHKVTNYCEVKYDMETKLEALHWDDFIGGVKCTWFDDGDYYAVYEDLDEEDDHERRKYAVYDHATGSLICLIADSGLVLDGCYEDEQYMNERNKLYKQIAVLAGWPERLPLRRRYKVKLVRTCYIGVVAKDEEEAAEIGRALSCGVSGLACDVVNEAMCNGDDDFICVEDYDRYCQENVSEEGCIKILKEYK